MDREEFKRIWLPLGDRLYRVAFSILGSEADAKDAVQDLYIRLWNGRERMENIDRPLGYGIRLIRNICIDRLRQRNAHGCEDISSIRDKGSADVLTDSADRTIIGKETLAALRSAMDRLPENQRTVAELRFFRQLDNEEISRMTGLSNVNVRVLVSRARNAIITSMKEFI